jgi:hypothetical protein
MVLLRFLQALMQVFKSLKGVTELTVYFAENDATHVLVWRFKLKQGARCAFSRVWLFCCLLFILAW